MTLYKTYWPATRDMVFPRSRLGCRTSISVSKRWVSDTTLTRCLRRHRGHIGNSGGSTGAAVGGGGGWGSCLENYVSHTLGS